jgi:hypothetical protein
MTGRGRIDIAINASRPLSLKAIVSLLMLLG